ncbi:MAG: Alvin_2107 family globule sulfur oxidation protein [Acidiferrobacteraceae bacterium]
MGLCQWRQAGVSTIEKPWRFIIIAASDLDWSCFMDSLYYQTIDTMEKKRVNPEYINGWACGFLHNPKREEQRLNEAYEAGYSDGWDHKTDGFAQWAVK